MIQQKQELFQEKLISQQLIDHMKSLQSMQSVTTLIEQTNLNQKQSDAIDDIQRRIFEYTNNLQNYEKNNIFISQNEVITTYFLRGRKQRNIYFYFGHGFGGTSLMFFPSFNLFLQKGNIVLWQVRGMGVGPKKTYQQIDDLKINDFYVEGLQKVINYYNHNNIVFVCHSLSAYIVLRYLLVHQEDERIKKSILLSPVGLTSKQRDQKNSVKSCSDFFDKLINIIGWKFNLTFKSPLRTCCCCLKTRILRSAFSQLTAEQLNIMVQLFQTLILLPDGSQSIFFRYFLPRVLPREQESIQQLVKNGFTLNYKIVGYYGGQKDWVDRKGGQYLSKTCSNFTIKQLSDGGHMFCLNQKLIKEVFQNQIL